VTFSKARSIFGPDAAPFNFKILAAGDGLTWATSDIESGTKKIIIAMLGQGWTPKEIMEALDVGKSRVSNVKGSAIKGGYLEEEGKTTIFTEKGNLEFGGVNIDVYGQ
jgi:hypothetical protein